MGGRHQLLKGTWTWNWGVWPLRLARPGLPRPGGPHRGRTRPSLCSLSLWRQQPPLPEPQLGESGGRSVEKPSPEPSAQLPRPSGEHCCHRTRLSPRQPLTVAFPAQAGGVQAPSEGRAGHCGRRATWDGITGCGAPRFLGAYRGRGQGQGHGSPRACVCRWPREGADFSTLQERADVSPCSAPLPFHSETLFSPSTWRFPCRLRLPIQAPQRPSKATIVMYRQTDVCLTTSVSRGQEPVRPVRGDCLKTRRLPSRGPSGP